MPENSMLTFDEALAVIHRNVSASEPVRVSLEDALGTVAAEDIHSGVDLPPADSSAMDGYAFAYMGQRKGDNLPVAGISMAGEPFGGVVQKGQVVKIMTGGIVPQGCDTVMPFEEVEESRDSICLKNDSTLGANVRYRAEEVGKEEILVEAGTTLGAREIGLVAAGAVPEVDVIPVPRVALITTGTELMSLGEQLDPGRIVNSNYYFLSARLRELGCDVLPLGTVPDDMKRLKRVFTEGLEADAIISTGGVSVGDRDLVQDSLSELGFDLGFWGVRMRPGKPVLFGMLKGKPVFGLPGNPAACGATFELFVISALERLAGMQAWDEAVVRATVTQPVRSRKDRDSFVWGVLKRRENAFQFTPNRRQGSGQHRSMAGAGALLRVPPDLGDLSQGWEGEAFPLRQHLLGGVL